MAIFHCQAKAISRGAGRSATAAAAYRAGEIIEDFRTGEVHDYSRKQGVCYTAILTSSGDEISRSELWNLAEDAEKRKDAKNHFKTAKIIHERGYCGSSAALTGASARKGSPP